MGSRVPTIYKYWQIKLIKLSGYEGMLHYSDVRKVLSWYKIPKPLKNSIIDDMVHYGLLKKEKRYLILNMKFHDEKIKFVHEMDRPNHFQRKKLAEEAIK